jgi:hypothetical protein
MVIKKKVSSWPHAMLGCSRCERSNFHLSLMGDDVPMSDGALICNDEAMFDDDDDDDSVSVLLIIRLLDCISIE